MRHPALLALALLLPSAPAGAATAAETCAATVAGLCRRLDADPRVVVRRTSADVLLLNPARQGLALWNDPVVSSRVAAGPDMRNFNGAIVPLFNALVGQLRARVDALPAGSRERIISTKRLTALRLRVDDRERCQDHTRPFVGGYDGAGVTLCPWMTHLGPEMLLTTLAHELGHFADPCWGSEDGRPVTPAIAPYSDFRLSDCSTDEEAAADRVGSVLSDEFLSGPAAATLSFPANADERAGAVLFYALTPACSRQDSRLLLLFASPSLRGLACPGAPTGAAVGR